LRFRASDPRRDPIAGRDKLTVRRHRVDLDGRDDRRLPLAAFLGCELHASRTRFVRKSFPRSSLDPFKEELAVAIPDTNSHPNRALRRTPAHETRRSVEPTTRRKELDTTDGGRTEVESICAIVPIRRPAGRDEAESGSEQHARATDQ